MATYATASTPFDAFLNTIMDPVHATASAPAASTTTVPVCAAPFTPSTRPALLMTFQSALVRRQRTLAQELMEAEGTRDAEELFALLGEVGTLEPTPTTERFIVTPPTPIFASTRFSEAGPAESSSRPSSRASSEDDDDSSSTASSAWNSFDDDDDVDSISSVSSVSSVEGDFDFLASTKPQPRAVLANVHVTSAPLRASVPAFERRVPLFIPTHTHSFSLSSSASASSSRTSISSASSSSFSSKPRHTQTSPASTLARNMASKNELTKYIYQGGVSTVLGGGVMLGSSPSKATSTSPKYRAPIPVGAGKKSFNQSASSVNSWRRAPVLRV